MSPLQGDVSPLHSAHCDCILVFGPDIPSKVIANAEKECQDRKFHAETLHTAGLGSLEDLRQHLHANGKLGPHTQVLFVLHGNKHQSGRHMLSMTNGSQGNGLVPTLETLRQLRWVDNEETSPEKRRLWGGTMHLVTCEGGLLEHEIQPGTAAWQEGDYLVYAGREKLLVHEGMRAVSHMLDCLEECKNRNVAPDPKQMLAYAAHRAGDGVTLLGASVQHAVVVEAPVLTPENIAQFHAGGWLKLQLHERLEARQDIDGLRMHDEDKEKILAALADISRLPAVEQANLYESKLKDVLLSAIGHQDVHTVGLLLAAKPDLAEARTLTHKPIEELAWDNPNPAVIDAVLNARLAILGPRPLLLQACARSDHRSALKLLAMSPEDAFNVENWTLAMQLAREDISRTYRFFEGFLEAARQDENHLARQFLRLAMEQEMLPLFLAEQWKEWEVAHPRQRLDDARLLKLSNTNESNAPAALAEACRNGDLLLLDMLLQRFGLGSASKADRPLLARLALEPENHTTLLGRLLDNALLHGDVAMFRAAWAQPVGQAFIREHGRLLLEQACMANQAKVARYLLRKVPVDMELNSSGETPLHLAASSGSQDVLALLLRLKPALDQPDKAGNTALHVACQAGQDQVAQQLVAAGAATQCRNAMGKTAREIAKEECSAATVAFLDQAAS